MPGAHIVTAESHCAVVAGLLIPAGRLCGISVRPPANLHLSREILLQPPFHGRPTSGSSAADWCPRPLVPLSYPQSVIDGDEGEVKISISVISLLIGRDWRKY